MKDFKTFESKRLLLRPVMEDDAEFVLKLLNSPKFLYHIGDRKVRTTEDARKYIRNKMLSQLKRLGYGNYAVVRKSDSTLMGTCSIFDREGLDTVDIGFAFLPEFEGQGYGYEAASRLLEAAFREFDIQKICAITTIENVASQGLIKKLGLKYAGTTRIPDDEEELLLYELDKTEI